MPIEIIEFQRRLMDGFTRNPDRKYTISELVKALDMPDDTQSRHKLIWHLTKLEEQGKLVDGRRGTLPFRLVEWGLSKK